MFFLRRTKRPTFCSQKVGKKLWGGFLPPCPKRDDGGSLENDPRLCYTQGGIGQFPYRFCMKLTGSRELFPPSPRFGRGSVQMPQTPLQKSRFASMNERLWPRSFAGVWGNLQASECRVGVCPWIAEDCLSPTVAPVGASSAGNQGDRARNTPQAEAYPNVFASFCTKRKSFGSTKKEHEWGRLLS